MIINTKKCSAKDLYYEIDRIIKNAGSHFEGYIIVRPYLDYLDIAIKAIMGDNGKKIFYTMNEDDLIIIYPGQGMSVEYILSKALEIEYHNHERCDVCHSDIVFGKCVGCGKESIA